jgi:hypothetical protein
MRKILGALLLVILSAITSQAQSTTVSGTITDAGSQAWANGTYSFQFVPNPNTPPNNYVWSGGAFNFSNAVTGSLNGSGAYSQSLPSNTAITPVGTQWQATFCPQAAPAQCYTTTLIITGSTQTLSPTPPAIKVPVTVANPQAYSDSEVTNAILGSTYYNLISNVIRTCTVSLPCTWVSGAPGSVDINTTLPVTGGPILGNGTIGLNVGSNCPSGAFTTGLDSQLNSLCATPTPPGQPPYVGPTAVNGCGVEWTGLLNFTVGQCSYIINGVQYNTPITPLTLTASDPTNPRIDAIYVDNTPVANFLTGTPAVSPVDPTIDPSTQLGLTFVEVAANATTPSNIASLLVFDECTEWTTAKGGTSSANVNLCSTNNPYSGTKDVEFGAGGTVATSTYAQFTDPAAGTITVDTYNSLIFYIRNKAGWPNNRSVTLQLYNGSTATGTPIVLNNTNFGFNATTNISGYQQINIPTSYFQANGLPITTLRFTVTGTGAALAGFYIDRVSWQAGINSAPPLPTTLVNFRGTYNATVQYNPNDEVVQDGFFYIALVANSNTPVTTTSTWAGCPNPVALTGQLLTASNAACPSFLSPGVGGRTVAGASDTILGDSATALRDRATVIHYTNTGAIAITLGQAGTSGLAAHFLFTPWVTGAAGVGTITPTTSTINGGSTLVLGQNVWCNVFSPDNSSYSGLCATWIKAGTGITPTYNADGSTTLAAATPSGSTTCNPGSYAAQTDGTTVTWAIGSNICANGSLLFTTHGGSRSLVLTGMVNGGDYILKLTQDGTGGEGLTLSTGCTWKVSGGGSGAITLSTGANAIDVLTWSYDGTNCLANLNKTFN